MCKEKLSLSIWFLLQDKGSPCCLIVLIVTVAWYWESCFFQVEHLFLFCSALATLTIFQNFSEVLLSEMVQVYSTSAFNSQAGLTHMLIYCRPESVQFPSHFNRWSWYISGTQDISRSNTADFVLFESTNHAQVAKWWASAHDATMLPGIPGTSSYSQVDPWESLPNHPNPRLEGFGSSCHKNMTNWSSIDLWHWTIYPCIQTYSNIFLVIQQLDKGICRRFVQALGRICPNKVLSEEHLHHAFWGLQSFRRQVLGTPAGKTMWNCETLISLSYPCDMPVIASSLVASGVRPKWPKCNVPRWAKNASNCK